MRLRAIEPALADDAARAESDRRLRAMVARPERVARGIDERKNAFLLVIVQMRPDERSGSAGRRGETEHDLP